MWNLKRVERTWGGETRIEKKKNTHHIVDKGKTIKKKYRCTNKDRS